MFHAADAEHGVVEIEAVEHAGVKVLLELRIAQHFRMPLAQILAGGDEVAGRSASGVADDVLRRRRRHLDHETDNVPRRAELAVLPRRGDLAEHVFVKVALGVPIFHRDVVDHVHDFCQKGRRRDSEPGILHVRGVGRFLAAKRAQKREYMFADNGVHVGRREVLEP